MFILNPNVSGEILSLSMDFEIKKRKKLLLLRIKKQL